MSAFVELGGTGREQRRAGCGIELRAGRGYGGRGQTRAWLVLCEAHASPRPVRQIRRVILGLARHNGAEARRRCVAAGSEH